MFVTLNKMQTKVAMAVAIGSLVAPAAFGRGFGGGGGGMHISNNRPLLQQVQKVQPQAKVAVVNKNLTQTTVKSNSTISQFVKSANQNSKGPIDADKISFKNPQKPIDADKISFKGPNKGKHPKDPTKNPTNPTNPTDPTTGTTTTDGTGKFGNILNALGSLAGAFGGAGGGGDSGGGDSGGGGGGDAGGGSAPGSTLTSSTDSSNADSDAASAPVATSEATPAAQSETATAVATSPSTAPSVDLVLEDIRLAEPATLVAGPAYLVKFRNQSLAPAAGFRVGIFAVQDNKLTDARTLVEVPGLEAGQAAEVTMRLPLAALKLATADGQTTEFNQLAAMVDVDKTLADSDRANNAAVVDRNAIEEAE